jgi:cyclophilin family peptidyl-prolyl cis-trans isomerase
MLQGGDPTGRGKGGQSIWGGPFEDELRDDLLHDARGIVAMANKGPNTNLSQFYIIYGPQPHLNNVSTVFGRVIHGLDTLNKMEKVPTEKDRPLPPGNYLSLLLEYFSDIRVHYGLNDRYQN